MKYRKLPVEIEAVQWTGKNDEEISAFAGSSRYMTQEGDLMIHTLEGDHHALVGDYIIKGVKGEFYPVKEEIFWLTYEEA